MHRFADLMTFVRLDSSGAWWGGVRIHDGQLDDPSLVTTLSETIYANAYVRGSPRPISPERVPFGNHLDAGLVDRLRAAATSSGREASVVVEAGSHGRDPAREGSVVVRNGLLRLTVQARDVVEGTVRMPGLRPRHQPGFFFCLSDAPGHAEAVTRVYWNLAGHEAALHLVRLVTETLNSNGCSFEMKVGTDSSIFGRADSGVLYLPASTAVDVIRRLRDVYLELTDANHLDKETPMWTRPLGHGVAAAGDPGLGQSFGEIRSKQAALAIIEAASMGGPDQVDASVAAWARLGVDPQAPYSIHDRFETVVDLPEFGSPSVRRLGRTPVSKTASPVLPEDLVSVVVDQLAERAICASGTATWLSTTASDFEGGPVLGSTGPYVYDGTAGIGLALAYASTVGAPTLAGRLALAALTCALDHCEDQGWREGFFAGTAGALAVAKVVGELCDAPWLTKRAQAVFRATWADEVDVSEPDVISGLAGTILGLASCQSEIARRALALRADQLVDLSESDREHRYWPGSDPEQWPWTGFAHGATGIASALATAARLSGREDLKDVALAALRYEDSWHDPDRENWADLRNVDKKVVPHPSSRRFAYAWCHGGPGIRAGRRLIDGVPSERVKRPFAVGSDGSLCHGFLGLMDLAVDRNFVLRQRDVHLLEKAARAQASSGDLVPGLMLGTAGIAYTAARLSRPSLESVLACLL